ncbi:hypothetical protein CI109_104698 [Kwoniella shandongensis]|uniref:Uncharacterized protein n=1 Tax=Kwoniella shandongensis TaxID=1734106 RepID=A0A5M6BX25_9TREE|nr:uncharacterized protein CI109_004861 [Kwoniella shandongensis]KAA5526861.1 hypothetical protein CI109_004861 [Kwoniella shandongensis]
MTIKRSNSATASAAAAIVGLATLPGALAMTPAARWGHQAVYVKSKQAMYVVGGEVISSHTEITNEVLILPLNTSSPSFSTGSSTGLPPHAFGSMIINPESDSLVVVGGMTSACGTDGTTHTLNLSSNDGWITSSPNNFVRRRGAGLAWVDNGSSGGAVMAVGGIADTYACASSTYSYPASDVLSLPISSSSLISSRNLPTSLTGSTLAVSDFSIAADPTGKIYLAGGQSSNGDLVGLETIGIWDASSGWTSQSTSGDVPPGRIGASLVAHPKLDLLVMQGGSVNNGSSDTPTALLAFLNTTSWAWSTPSNLQPPASSAVSYHTSVMTDQGVMISAFGLSASGSPRSDVYYLDMRDPTGSSWTWKSSWNNNMLAKYTPSNSNTGSTAGNNNNSIGTTAAAADTKSGSGHSTKHIISIAIPVIVVLILLAPIVVYLIRRRVRLIKKRRMARHFSFSSQEDEGGFTSPFSQYINKRRTKTQFPFGRDANEKDGTLVSDFTGGLARMVSRLSSRSNSDEGHDGQATDREMVQVARKPIRLDGPRGSKQPMNWEEIDFGLGKLDESRHSDPSYGQQAQHDSAVHGTSDRNINDEGGAAYGGVSFPVASAATAQGAQGYEPRALFNAEDEHMAAPPLVTLNDSTLDNTGSPLNDGQGPLLPSVVIMPPTAPATPAINSLSTAYPAMEPTPATGPQQQDGLDWNQLQQELDNKPAFRSISPHAQLRSHAHASAPNVITNIQRTESPRPITPTTPPSLPPLEFQRTPSPSGTITLVNPRTGRRSAEYLPFSSSSTGLGPGAPSPRSVSSPTGARQIAGGLARRGSAPLGGQAKPSANVNPFDDNASPLSSGQSTPKAGRPLSYDASVRRASAGSLTYPAGNGGERRGSQLRVVNVTDSDDEEDKSGQAI